MTDNIVEPEERDVLVSPNFVHFTKQIEELNLVLSNNNNNDHELLRAIMSKGLGGILRHSQIRSICWRVFLGVLGEKQSEWTSVLSTHRERYQSLIQTHIVDPRNQHVEREEDLEVFNPLSQSESNPWSQYFENSELEKIIEQDLHRLYPEHPFFRESDIVKMMQRILFLWSKENPKPSYRQGMHELLAPFILVFYRDAHAVQGSAPSDVTETSLLIQATCDQNYLEHDCYTVFERLMVKMKEYFQVVEVPRSVKKDVTGLIDRGAILDEKISKTPLHQMCIRIQSNILGKKDVELSSHLKELSIEPQIYLLRWIRLLFGREFHIEDVLVIWDAIFADCGGFREQELDAMLIDLSIVEHISVMMLTYIRSQLLEADYSSCLKRLMKYPPVEDVHVFIEKALQSRQHPNEKLTHLPEIKIPVTHLPTTMNFSPVTQKEKTAEKDKRKQKIKSSLFAKPPHSLFKLSNNDKKTPAVATASPSVASSLFTTTPNASLQMDPQSRGYVDKEVEIGNTMEKVIDLLQKVVLERENGFDEDAFFMSLAELKHIRDILKFQLPYSPMSLDWMEEFKHGKQKQQEKQELKKQQEEKEKEIVETTSQLTDDSEEAVRDPLSF